MKDQCIVLFLLLSIVKKSSIFLISSNYLKSIKLYHVHSRRNSSIPPFYISYLLIKQLRQLASYIQFEKKKPSRVSSWSKRVSSNRIWPPVRLCRIRGTRYVISRCTGHGSMDTRHCVARRGESGRGKPSFRGGGSRWMDALECRLVTGGARVVK